MVEKKVHPSMTYSDGVLDERYRVIKILEDAVSSLKSCPKSSENDACISTLDYQLQKIRKNNELP